MDRKWWEVVLAAAVLAWSGCDDEVVQHDAGPTGLDASSPVDTVCASDRECSASGRLCDVVNGYCVECLGPDDCAEGEACRRALCVEVVPCTSSRTCAGLVCDRDRGYCVECVTEVDCMDDEVCAEGYCVPPPRACESDRDCSDLDMVCDTAAGRCATCVLDPDCPEDRWCSTDRRCLPDVCEAGAARCASATTIEECTPNGAGYGAPSECGDGRSCEDGACRAPPEDDAGAADAGPPDAGAADAGTPVEDAGPREQPPVTSELGPVSDFGMACDETGILARGGSATGLARSDVGTPILIDAWNVTACVSADFGAIEPFAEILVIAEAVSTACGISCSTLCGTGRDVRVFQSTDDATYTFVGQIFPSETPAEHRLSVGAPFRYALVCRSGAGQERDQFLIDYVAAIRR